MKKIYFITTIATLLWACGGKNKVNGISLADEVCECRKKGKGLEFSDPKAKEIRMECSKIQGENWAKIIDNKNEEEAFNKRLNECTDEMLNEISK